MTETLQMHGRLPRWRRGRLSPDSTNVVSTPSRFRRSDGYPAWHPRAQAPIAPHRLAELTLSGSLFAYSANPQAFRMAPGQFNLGNRGLLKVVSGYVGSFADLVMWNAATTLADPFVVGLPLSWQTRSVASTSTDAAGTWLGLNATVLPPKNARYVVPAVNALLAAGSAINLDTIQIAPYSISNLSTATWTPPRALKAKVVPTRLNYSLCPTAHARSSAEGLEVTVTESNGYQRARCGRVLTRATGTIARLREAQEIDVIPGEPIAVSVHYRAQQALTNHYRVAVEFRTGKGGTPPGTAKSTEAMHEGTSGEWVRLGLTTTAPRGAQKAVVYLAYSDEPVETDEETFYLGGVLIEKARTLGDYFDGDSGEDYLWRVGQTAGLTWSYYYESRSTRNYVMERTLRENLPLGVRLLQPEYATWGSVPTYLDTELDVGYGQGLFGAGKYGE